MAELRNISWGRLLRDIRGSYGREIVLKSRSLQWLLTYCLRQQGYMLLDDLDGLELEYRGVRFQPDLLNYPRMFEAWDRYQIDRLRKDDVVLDIGANIGSFALPAAQRCQEVIALEPLFFAELVHNIRLNNLKNLYPINLALGGVDDSSIQVDCGGFKQGPAWSTSLTKLLERIKTKPTVLRLDCGGEEWNILWGSLEELELRQLEIEFHFYTKEQRERSYWELWKVFLDDWNYLARWSKHRHWLYLSAWKDNGPKVQKEVQLIDGSFRGRNLELWKGVG